MGKNTVVRGTLKSAIAHVMASSLSIALLFLTVSSGYSQSKRSENSKGFQVSGNTYSSIKTGRVKGDTILTPFTFQVKDRKYPIYLSSNDKAYIGRISKNGNYYRQYLGEEISKDVKSKMKSTNKK